VRHARCARYPRSLVNWKRQNFTPLRSFASDDVFIPVCQSVTRFFLKLRSSGASSVSCTSGPVKKGRAILRGVIRKTRKWDNRHWARPIPDAARARHRGSVVEVACKSESLERCSQMSSFSSPKISAIIKALVFRVRRIFDYHSRGDPDSLFRDRKREG